MLCLIQFPKTVIFKPFSVHELHYIFEHRIDSTLFAKGVLLSVADGIAKKKGGVESGLDYLWNTLKECRNCLEDDEATSTGPLVFTKHVLNAKHDEEPSLWSLIHSFSKYDKCVLCILAIIGKDKCMKITLGELERSVVSCMQEATAIRDVKLTIDELAFLVKTIDELTIQPEEVIKIVEEDLKQSFSHNMIVKAREMRDAIKVCR